MRALVAAAACLLLGLSAQARASVLVTISKADQQMSVVVDGSERYRWPVSTGRPGYATPTGSFHPIRLEESWFSRRFDNAPMPHSVFFHYGYAVHGTMEESRLGRPVSHGCVRLSRVNAATLFDLVREQGFAQSRIVVVDGSLSGGAPATWPDRAPPRFERDPDASLSVPPRHVVTHPRPVTTDADFEDWSEDPPPRATSRSYVVEPRRHPDESALRRLYEQYGFHW
ncbi:MAG TPA: L,D-transpeptidase family protein [Pseudolabrys sp.]|nr:L,D-transpeptidase family protein [Pseudolabrys sp.]